jgi:hypothetical protein
VEKQRAYLDEENELRTRQLGRTDSEKLRKTIEASIASLEEKKRGRRLRGPLLLTIPFRSCKG